MSEISATTTRARSGSGLRGRFDAVMERFGSQAIVYVIFVGIIAFFAVYAPSFATGSSLANIGRQTAAITIVAVGMTVFTLASPLRRSTFFRGNGPWSQAVRRTR